MNSRYDNKSNPLVSILMPVYNASDYLVGALDSILNQTYQNWELIAIDDCSTDNSYLILQKYSEMDSRIKPIKNLKNIGVGNTLDRAVKLANGYYIARMDADDISYADRLEKQVAYLQENTDIIAVGGQCRLIDETGNFIGVKKFPVDSKTCYEMLYSAVPIQHPTLMVDKRMLPEDFSWYDGWPKAQDLYLFFKLVNYGGLSNLTDYVLDYRYYRGGNSLKNPKHTFKLTNQIRYIAKTKFGYIPSLKSRLINLLQLCIVSILPNFAIFWLYKIVRSFANMSKMTSEQRVEILAVQMRKTTRLAKKAVQTSLME